MGCDSVAYLKGFVEPKRIFDYIRNNMDHNMIHDVKWETICGLDSINFKEYKESEMPIIFSKCPDDLENWRMLSGWIRFNMWNQNQAMFYYYSPLQSREGLDDCYDHNEIEMMNSETTCLRMPACKESVWTLTNIAKYFGGGWIYENDCEENTFYKIK